MPGLSNNASPAKKAGAQPSPCRQRILLDLRVCDRKGRAILGADNCLKSYKRPVTESRYRYSRALPKRYFQGHKSGRSDRIRQAQHGSGAAKSGSGSTCWPSNNVARLAQLSSPALRVAAAAIYTCALISAIATTAIFIAFARPLLT